jgi:GTP-binding protein
MVISSVSYLKGIIGTDDLLYDGKYQFAFIGRSNVGKSSLINSLVGKEIARSSKYPGRTKRLDFFLINKSFYFVDLPGYGYAKVPGPQHEKIRKMILWYLLYSEVKDRLVILIIDAFVGITAYDRETMSIFNTHSIPYIIIANKIDKIPQRQKDMQLKKIKSETTDKKIILYSTVKNIGRRELLDELEKSAAITIQN